MPAAEREDDMRAWLTDADDAPSNVVLWGEAKDHYTLKDLDKWLKAKVGTKGKVVKKVAGRVIAKEKAKVVISQSTAKGKEKEVAPEPKAAAKSHKKKKLTTG
jgi:predicted urease superfamily metal-dependent hydrolase